MELCITSVAEMMEYVSGRGRSASTTMSSTLAVLDVTRSNFLHSSAAKLPKIDRMSVLFTLAIESESESWVLINCTGDR